MKKIFRVLAIFIGVLIFSFSSSCVSMANTKQEGGAPTPVKAPAALRIETFEPVVFAVLVKKDEKNEDQCIVFVSELKTKIITELKNDRDGFNKRLNLPSRAGLKTIINEMRKLMEQFVLLGWESEVGNMAGPLRKQIEFYFFADGIRQAHVFVDEQPLTVEKMLSYDEELFGKMKEFVDTWYR